MLAEAARLRAPRTGTSARSCRASPAAARGAGRARRRRGTIGAVPSGRSVSERSPRSVNVYISFCTTSEPCPDVRVKSSVSSKTGVVDPRGSRTRRTESLRLADHAAATSGCSRGQDVVRAARRLELVTRRGARRGTGCARARRRASSAGRGPNRRRSRAGSARSGRGSTRASVSQSPYGRSVAPDRAGEEHVAGEERAVRRSRRGGPGEWPGTLSVSKVMPGELERLAAVEARLSAYGWSAISGNQFSRLREDGRLEAAACRRSPRCARHRWRLPPR